MNFKRFFDTLQDWKRLPAYRMEPRIDSFICFFLPDILEENVELTNIIPELPIRLGTVNPDLGDKNHAERSYRVDFYLLGADGIHYFVKVKSDSGSRRESQDVYLKKSVDCGMQSIVEGIILISKITSNKYKEKYQHLLGKLRDLGLINDEEKFTGSKNDIKVIYIQPKKLEDDKAENVIDFKTIAKILQKKYPTDDFTLEYAKALDAWSGD